MRSIFSLGLLMMAACGGTNGGDAHRGAPAKAGEVAPPAPEAPSTTSAALSCPSGLPAAKVLLTDVTTADLHVVNGRVWFRTDQSVDRIEKDGTGRQSVVKSPDLVRAYVDEQAILTVESNDGTTSVLHGYTLEGASKFATPNADLVPASVQIFGSDVQSFYFQGDENGQDTIYRLDKSTGLTTTLVTFGETADDIISDPQVVGTDLWFVRAGKRVYKASIGTTDDGKLPGQVGDATPPSEVFASGFQTCRLAVGGGAAYCSDGKQIVRRDLNGANATTIFDSSTDTTPVGIGAPMFQKDVLFTMPGADEATSPLKAVIRQVRPSMPTADAKVLACGRGTVTDLSVDTVSVAWVETGSAKGLYLAPR